MNQVDQENVKSVQKAPDLPVLVECAARYWWACLLIGCLLAAAGYAVDLASPVPPSRMCQVAPSTGITDSMDTSSETVVLLVVMLILPELCHYIMRRWFHIPLMKG